MECWASAVRCVAFFDDQAINPVAVHLFVFETFHEFQQAVFKLERKRVQILEVRFRQLLGFPVGVQPGHRLAQGCEGDVKELDVFANRPPTAPFGNVEMNRVSGSNRLRSHSLQLVGGCAKNAAVLCIVVNRVFPDP